MSLQNWKWSREASVVALKLYSSFQNSVIAFKMVLEIRFFDHDFIHLNESDFCCYCFSIAFVFFFDLFCSRCQTFFAQSAIVVEDFSCCLFYISLDKNLFRFTSFVSLTSLGDFHSSLILLKVLLAAGCCAAKESKMYRKRDQK